MEFKYLLIVLFLVFPSVAGASEFKSGSSLVIPEDQIINDDLYFAGNSIIVEGTINGDLIAAGNEITVLGTVNGSLMVAGGSITVDGVVKDDIRAAGGTITIDGDVGDNVLVFGGNLILGKKARINRDLTMGAGSAVIDGTVNGNINGGASTMEMRGTAGGNVTVNINKEMNILPGARINGNLEYTAPEPMKISGSVSGKTTYKEAPAKKEGIASRLSGEILMYLWLLLIGVISLMLVPEISQRTSDAVSTNPLRNLLWGILCLIVTPILAVILLITLIGIPLSLVIIAIYIIAVYVSRIYVGLWIGQYALKKLKMETRYKAVPLAVGLLIVFIGINLPILGTFIHIVIVVLGLGAIALTEYDLYRKLKGEKVI